MHAPYILAVLAFVFAVAAALRWRRNAKHFDPATRTWLLIAAIFTAIAAWLQWHTS
ncbi:uncharacterized membrane protein YoaK (UPF0700 family) [Variovorax sp. SG517]|uniref:hypothetical protein n=1 Tax=Variovorax sp. SG517 TaxID=2587117 RepID=UPI00159DB049|nr:hypothetical protein [Variovorax sp. SG517]NVM90079.1 uncharacterized membrane protein YoaK (UPF0700 family) [Variovorax sp. SG517]